MEQRCHHHPDREAEGSCHYCDRPMCGECLRRNAQGRSFCRREDDCLAFQDELAGSGPSDPPLISFLRDTMALEGHVERIDAVLEELREVDALLEAPDEGQPEQAGTLVARCGLLLAQEAAALVELTRLRLAVRQILDGQEEDTLPDPRIAEIETYLAEEAAPRIHVARQRHSFAGEPDVAGLVSAMARAPAST